MPAISCRIVEVCVFKFEKDQAWYLLLHRSRDEKEYPDIWQVISGVIEDNEKAVDAAMRELTEETKLKPKAFWNVPYANSFYDHVHNVVNVSPLFAAQVETGSEPTLSSEHFEYAWFTFNDAYRKLIWPGQRFGLEIVNEYIIGGQRAANLTRLF
jgi:dATP pyrophosphohydrolase